MDPMHEANVDELLGEMTKILKANCVKLYKSGGVDIEKYETCDFALAKSSWRHRWNNARISFILCLMTSERISRIYYASKRKI